MRGVLWNFKIKKRSTLLAILIVFIYGALIAFIPDFALWTSSFTDEIFTPMKAFFSFHSVFSMTFIILPAYLFWIYSSKNKDILSLRITRYISIDRYVNEIFINCFFEALFFSTLIFTNIAILGITNIFRLKWSMIVIKALTTLLGLWIINLFAELLFLVFTKKGLFAVCISFVVVILEYLLYCMLGFSLITVPLLTVRAGETIISNIAYILYAIVILIFLYNTLDSVLKRKSVY